MVDPLRSLAELVRTLTRSRADRRGNTGEATRQTPAAEQGSIRDTPASANNATEAIRERLRQRLRLVGTSDQRRAREAFVETVLAAELGDRITLDPAMSEIVSRIAEQLGADANTNRDLGLLFDELARDAR